ncbi:1,4-alpha-glucan branching protein domain-containing protein [Alkalihalobacterium bogoriense]|uniref:1,4-alpha-glucan branching protein domain-containing protein n=1 Tax=Alkalihalobacterium bogoriense TaxID=246272 RepID=UPI00047B56EB|nr:1,4-alpha-glucan branching protein domain-containing protein [Alkalihalobacterium bogoriense]
MATHSIFLLHAHLPDYRTSNNLRLEERALFQAIFESYLPLLETLSNRKSEAVVTMSFSPTLLQMLTDDEVLLRFETYTEQTLALLRIEKQTVPSEVEREIVCMYEKRYEKLFQSFYQMNKNIVFTFRKLVEEGIVEAITTAATHPFLPYIQTRKGKQEQIRYGLDIFIEHFGFQPKGFWLPECGYSAEVGDVLVQEGLEYTFLSDATICEPSQTEQGLVLLPINRILAERVWSSTTGYPAHPLYREYYWDISFKRDWNQLSPYVNTPVPVDTGLKYWKVTGHEEKDWYNREEAIHQAKIDSTHFTQKLLELDKELAVLAFDAELFGHWWYEGPDWLAHVISEQKSIPFVSPQKWISMQSKPLPLKTPQLLSSWGRGGYGEVWLNERNASFYKIFHEMEDILFSRLQPEGFVYEQMKNEWRLAISSDWLFMIDANRNANYGYKRIQEHIECFFRLYKQQQKTKNKQEATGDRKVLLLLSFEYPPTIFGGLGIHVHHLAETIAKRGERVHVVTYNDKEKIVVEKRNGVIIHRIPASVSEDFYLSIADWNREIIDYVLSLSNRVSFSIIHAHDWLVASSALVLKESLHCPLLATIHATEAGRNQGIKTSLQQAIHHLERKFVQQANHIIVCSQFMKTEIHTSFKTSLEKISIIPNGVILKEKHKVNVEDGQTVIAIGRFVYEKGFTVFIDAAKHVLLKYPKTRFILAGQGEMKQDYVKQIQQVNIAESFHIKGFLQENEKWDLYHEASVVCIPSVYEPFGIVALEAMACGKPIVASNTGGLKEVVVHNQTGIIVPPCDSERLAEGIIELLSKPNRAEQLGERGRQEVQQYCWSEVTAQTTNVYRQLLS